MAKKNRSPLLEEGLNGETLYCLVWCSFDEMGLLYNLFTLPGVLALAGVVSQPGCGPAAVSTKAALASPVLYILPSF